MNLTKKDVTYIMYAIGLIATSLFTIKINKKDTDELDGFNKKLHKLYKSVGTKDQYKNTLSSSDYRKFIRMIDDIEKCKSINEMIAILQLINEIVDKYDVKSSSIIDNPDIKSTMDEQVDLYPDEVCSHVEADEDEITEVEENHCECGEEGEHDCVLTAIPVDVPTTQEEGFESDPINRISDNLMYLCDDATIKLDDFITFLENMSELRDINKDVFDIYISDAEEIINIQDDDEQAEEFAKFINKVNSNPIFTNKAKAQMSR